MSKSTRGIRAAGVASLAVTLSIGVAAPAFAAPGFEFTRIAGDDRYETAVEAAEVYGASDDVILANGQPGEYADALAGNYLAGAEDAPILLTKRKELPASTKAQIDDIDPATIWVVGGEAAVPADQVAALEADGYNVERIAGDDRFATNAEVIAKDGAAKDGLGLIATGLNFPDALSAGPFAYQGHSLGLSRTNSLPDVVGDALEADGVTSVLIFGGTDAVGAGVVSDLAARGITVEERFAGADRSETSELAAEWALENLSFTDEHVGVASGYTDGFGADALAGGPVEGNEMSPMLITRNVDNPDDVIDYLENHANTLADGHIYGGTAAISAAAEAEMEKAARSVTSNQDLTVNPQTAATFPLADEGSATASVRDADNRTYTLTGLDAGTTYSIGLTDAKNVSGTDALVTFKDDEDNTPNNAADDDGLADDLGSTAADGEVAADIVTVNGATMLANTVYFETVPVNGGISFTIDGDAVGSVIPVVWVDANANDQVDLNAANQPTEDFGIGGVTTYTAPAATAGDDGGVVQSVNKEANNFTADDELYTYDGNDQYVITGQGGVDQAAFEAALSSGDTVTVANYSPNSAGVSQFTLADDNPTTPSTDADADKGVVTDDDSNDITVTVTGATITDEQYDSVVIQRAPFNAANPNRTWTTIATVDKSADADKDTTDDDFNYVDRNVANGQYVYRSALINDGDQSAFSDESAPVTATAPTSDTTAPTSLDTRIVTNGGNPLALEDGDTFRVVFNEVMKAPDANDTIRLRDEDGSVVDLVNGVSGVVFTLEGTPTTVGGTEYPANTVLTVEVGTTAPSTAGTIAGLNVPATVTQQSGVTDPALNQWNLAGSADVVVDNS